MAIIKKFRIKSFKQKKPILKLENVSLSFGSRQILENYYSKISKELFYEPLYQNLEAEIPKIIEDYAEKFKT